MKQRNHAFDFLMGCFVFLLLGDAGFQHAPGDKAAAPFKIDAGAAPFGEFVQELQLPAVGFQPFVVGDIQHGLDFGGDLLHDFGRDFAGLGLSVRRGGGNEKQQGQQQREKTQG
jgi:hypothetical protein